MICIDITSLLPCLAEASARIQMQNFVAASGPVILYIDKLFISRELGVDW